MLTYVQLAEPARTKQAELLIHDERHDRSGLVTVQFLVPKKRSVIPFI